MAVAIALAAVTAACSEMFVVGRNGTDRPQPLARSRSVHFTLCFCLRTFVVSSVRTVLFCLSGVSARRCEPWLLLPQRDLRDHALRVVRIRPDGHEDCLSILGGCSPSRPPGPVLVARSQAGPSCAGLGSVVCCPRQLATHTTALYFVATMEPRSDAHSEPDRWCPCVLPSAPSVAFCPLARYCYSARGEYNSRPLPVVRTVPCTVRFLSQCLHSRWLLRAFCW